MTTDTKPRAPTDAEIIALMGDPRYSTIGAVREAISRWGQLYTTPQPAQAQAIQGVQWQCGPQASGFMTPQADSGAAPLPAYPPLPDLDGTLWLAIGQHRRAITHLETTLAAKAVDTAVYGLLRAYVDADRALRASRWQAPAGAAPTTQPAPVAVAGPSEAVAYLDIGAGGYLDLGTDLADEALSRLPKGRHALVIAGTYGIDGYVAAPQPSYTAQAAECVLAEEREKERIAFKDAHRHLELDEVPDAWARPMFKHSHVEASWLGWIARAARAPADSVLEDAARYRFLRDGEWRDTDLEPFIRLQLNTLWDAKIDAARAAQEGKSCLKE